jgi:hypothetical protein
MDVSYGYLEMSRLITCVSRWKKPKQSMGHGAHGYLLPLLSQCLPLADEICRPSLNFTKACICNDSS